MNFNQRQRGFVLTDGALQHLNQSISERFPYKNFSRVYNGVPGSEYNYGELLRQIQNSNSSFAMHSDTLRKILRRNKGVDESSLKMLFDFFQIPFENSDRESFTSNANKTASISKRIDLIQKPGCNLPRPPYTEFVGRQDKLKTLLHDISLSHRPPIIVIAGLVGVGKTALALEAAYLCWEAKHGLVKSNDVPVFDAIIFVSAKKDTYLSPHGFIDCTSRQSNLDDIFRTIAHVLNEPLINRRTGQEQIQQVYSSLSKQKTLLIVDDLHSMTSEEQIRVMSFLNDSPPSTKVLATTHINRLHAIRLEPLSEEESLQLIQQLGSEKGLDINDKIAQGLYESFQGFPMAFIIAIGRLACGISIEAIVCESCPIRQNIVQYSFEKVIWLIQGTPAHKLLMAIAFFHNPPNKNAVIQVAGLNEEPHYEIESDLLYLSDLSLISQQNDRYEMLSSTRNYVLMKELCQHPDFELGARERWVTGYIDFTCDNGGIDWGDWYIKYDRINEEWGNILLVLNWCAKNEQYDKVNILWRHINHFADLYGYWRDRIFWLDWLLLKSRELADRETTIYALTKKLWTLTMMGKFDDAQEILVEAWNLDSYGDIIVQDYLHHNSAVFHIRQKNFQEANEILDRKEQLINLMGHIDERQVTRCQINTWRDRGKIAFRQQQFALAENIYQKVLTAADEIGWYRAYCYTCNILANINIDLGNFEVARNYLERGLPIAERNRNKRRIAYYKYSLAKIEMHVGNMNLAREQAESAIIEFTRLEMKREIEEISNLFGI